MLYNKQYISGCIPDGVCKVYHVGHCFILKWVPCDIVYRKCSSCVKGKAVPLQAWSGPEGSRKLRFPDYMTMAQDGGKVVSLMHQPLFNPRKCSWYSFLLEAESTPGP